MKNKVKLFINSEIQLKLVRFIVLFFIVILQITSQIILEKNKQLI